MSAAKFTAVDAAIVAARAYGQPITFDGRGFSAASEHQYYEFLWDDLRRDLEDPEEFARE